MLIGILFPGWNNITLFKGKAFLHIIHAKVIPLVYLAGQTSTFINCPFPKYVAKGISKLYKINVLLVVKRGLNIEKWTQYWIYN